jgi:hypothetical protein
VQVLISAPAAQQTQHGQVPGHSGDCIDYPVTGIFDLTKASLWKRREVFSFSFDEKSPERGPVPGHSGVCIDYPVTWIISFERKPLSGNRGRFFLFHLMKNHRSVDRLLANF